MFVAGSKQDYVQVLLLTIYTKKTIIHESARCNIINDCFYSVSRAKSK